MPYADTRIERDMLRGRGVVRRTIAAGCMATLIASASIAGAADWPQWLGPQRSGVADAGERIADAGADGYRVLWRKQIGIGFASMAAAGGRVYAMGAAGGKETVWCLDAKSGDVIWQQSYAGELVDRLHEGGPSATPAIADGRVYTVGKQGQLYCYEAESGKEVWSANLRQMLDLRQPEWGFCSSPLVEGGRVYLQAGAMVALDAATGAKLWASPMHKPSYSSPIAFDHGGKRLLATLDSDGLSIVSMADGSQIAAYRWKTSFDTNSTTPVIMGDLIFVSTGYNRGCAMLKFDGSSLAPVYVDKTVSNHMNNSVPHDGYLYGFDGNTSAAPNVALVCKRVADGKEMWRKIGMGVGSLIIADGKIVALSDRGELVVAPAIPDGFKPASRTPILTGKCWTMPIVADGVLFARSNDRGELVAVRVGP